MEVEVTDQIVTWRQKFAHNPTGDQQSHKATQRPVHTALGSEADLFLIPETVMSYKQRQGVSGCEKLLDSD